jgi:tRNA threonylcarbamoyladenosine modification (KEOPS) complex Cgi121 subunit
LRAHARVFLCGADQSPEELKGKLAARPGKWVVQTAAEGSAANESLVEMIAAQTLRAEASGTLLAKSPEMDLLLRLAGTSQISKAIRERGSAKGRPFLLIVAGGTRPRVADGLAELPRRDLSKAELEQVERAALLSAQRA